MKRIHISVRGRVQGVGYRYFTRDVASRLGLTGWVRNRPDGSVELEAQGSDDQLAALREALGDGPPLARVTGLVARPGAPIEGEGGFAVRY